MNSRNLKRNLGCHNYKQERVAIKHYHQKRGRGFHFIPGGIVFLLVLALSLPGYAADTNAIQTQILSGQEALYQGRFEEALQTFTTITQHYPHDPRGHFFIALTYRWLTRTDPDSSDYQKQFEQAAKKTITVSESVLKKDAGHLDALLYLAATYGYRAEYYNFLKNRWDRAYDDAVKMRELLEKAEKHLDSENIDVQLGYGLYNYYAYIYRKKIGWWRFVLSLPKGDKKKGIKQLEHVRQNGTFLNVEAWYFLSEIYKKDGEFKDKAAPLGESLHRTYPGHPYFHIFLAGIYHSNLDWKNSLATAQDILTRINTSPYYSEYIVYQAKYLIGESSFYLGQYEEALRQFDEIIAARPSNPTYLLAWAHLRRGTIYQMRGKKEEAATEFHAVLQLEDTFHVHKLARAFLDNQKRQQ